MQAFMAFFLTWGWPFVVIFFVWAIIQISKPMRHYWWFDRKFKDGCGGFLWQMNDDGKWWSKPWRALMVTRIQKEFKWGPKAEAVLGFLTPDSTLLVRNEGMLFVEYITYQIPKSKEGASTHIMSEVQRRPFMFLVEGLKPPDSEVHK